MRILNGVVVVMLAAAAWSCGLEREGLRGHPAESPAAAPQTQAGDFSLRAGGGAQAQARALTTTIGGRSGVVPSSSVSLSQAGVVQAAELASERKIIRDAELTIEVDAPKDGQARIGSIAESLGGFVVTSEFKQNGGGPSRPRETVTVVVRVPANQFNAALEAIRGLAGRVVQEKQSGQDVTEEYIDLEARIRTQKALEGQFLEIMKQARKVEDALEVQRQLAEVRNEIERLEGRRRFLDNRSSLSTITVNLQTSAPLVTASTTGFGHDVKQAFGDGVDTAVAIVSGIIRLVIVLVPVVLFILLPAGLVLRFAVRRVPWFKKPKPAAEAQ